MSSDNAAAYARYKNHRVIWSDAEWVTIVRALIRLFPSIGLPAIDAVKKITLRQMAQAVLVMPPHRQRKFGQLSGARGMLARACRAIESAKPQPEPIQDTPPPRGRILQVSPPPRVSVPISPPPSTVYRQPDGQENGEPKKKIFLKEFEWDAIAIELAYANPAFLETISNIRPADVWRAQRVLPSNRRRLQSSLHNQSILPFLTSAFRRLRAAVTATRAEAEAAKAQAQAEAAADQSAREAEAQHGAQEAAIKAMRAELLSSPDFIAQALSQVAIGPLFNALAARVTASAQGIIEAAIVNALSSERVKNAMVINLYTDHQTQTTAPAAPAAPPTNASNAAAESAIKTNVIVRPRVGIIGALSQQSDVITAAYPQLKIKGIDKNLTGSTLKEAIQNLDKVIAMTHFITHSVDGICSKTLGARYTRVDGGVSAVRRQIDVWLASGTLGAVTAEGEKN